MKTIFNLLSTAFLILSVAACSSLKNISFNDDNDSYVNAKKERQKKLEQLAIKKQQEEARKKQIQDSIAKEQEKMNNNPYYKEPNYNKDDYYDYEYAARIKRFYNPVSGLGYYDNWYTNCGFYGCPNYGTSIYMGYGNYYSPYYGLGTTFGNPYFSYGLGWGYPSYYSGYGGYYSPWLNPYYTPYAYSPFYSPYYSPYYGYTPLYYNTQDINSMTYAPRSSHEGFNSRRTMNNINNSGENNFSKPFVVTPNENIPKFDETARPRVVDSKPIQLNALNSSLIHQLNTNPAIQSNVIPRNTPIISNGTNINNNNNNPGTTIISTPKNSTYNPGRPNMGNAQPVIVSPKEDIPNINNSPTQKNWGGGNNNASPSPRSGGNTGGGSFGRPR